MMQARHYFDIEARGANLREGAVTALPILTRLYAVLHGVMRTRPDTFAVGFPDLKPNARALAEADGKSVLAIAPLRAGDYRHPGIRLRIFAATPETLDILKQELSVHERLKGYLRYEYPETIPPDYAGPWREYRRYRIPNQKSRLTLCREARFKAADNLPFFRFTSKLTGHGFILHIACIDSAPPPPDGQAHQCAPDSYGLSVPARAFALPMMPR